MARTIVTGTEARQPTAFINPGSLRLVGKSCDMIFYNGRILQLRLVNMTAPGRAIRWPVELGVTAVIHSTQRCRQLHLGVDWITEGQHGDAKRIQRFDLTERDIPGIEQSGHGLQVSHVGSPRLR
jgi:hypothetical protein